MRKFLTTFALAFIMILTSSCGNDDTTSVDGSTEDEATLSEAQNSTESTDENKEIKTELSVAARPLQSFNPLTNTDEHNKYIFSLIYDDLYYMDENLKYTSNIIDSTIFSPDGKTVTLKVNPNASWSDGTNVLAEDIVYSINQLRYSQNPLYLSNISFVASVTADAEDTVTVYCNKAMNENTFNLCVPIVDESFYKVAQNELEMQNLKTNGSGKYSLSEVVDSRNYKLSVVDKYSSTSNIKTINIKIIENFEFEIDAFNANIIDLIVMNPEDLKEVKNSETTTITNVPTNQYEFIALNFQNPLINDINVRRALAYALPTDETVQSMFLNASNRTQSNVNPKSYLYNKDLISYSEDFEKSRQFLVNSGFNKLDNEGFAIKEKEGTIANIDLNILVNEENTYRVNLAKKYAENLKAVGIKSQIIEVPFDEYMTRLNEGRYDLAFAGYLTDNSQNNISMFSEGNILKFTSNQIKNIQGQLATISPEVSYEEQILALQTVVNNDLPVLSICYKDVLLLSNNKVNNVKVSIDNYFNNIESWIVTE